VAKQIPDCLFAESGTQPFKLFRDIVEVARELPMKAFLLLVTWLASNQPPSHYQVQFSSNETCEAARQQLIKDAERIGLGDD